MPFVHPKVLKIASIVRKWAEKKAKKEQGPSDLCGYCAIASHRLHSALQNAGIKNSKIVYAHNHAYVKVGNRVIDVTATQFGHKKGVALGHEGKREYWPIEDTYSKDVLDREEFTNPDSFIEHQEATGWPQDQIAKPESPSFERMSVKELRARSRKKT